MEKEPKRTFDQLNTVEKVRAVLAAARDPLPKREVFRYAGIVYDSLNQQQKEAIDQIFSSTDITMSMVKVREDLDAEEGFELSQGSKALIMREIDAVSINKRISDQMWADMDGDELFDDN